MATISGGTKLEQALCDLARRVARPATLSVGFFERNTYPDGKPVAMIAAIQEFGAPSRGIPPRPFFRNMVAAKSGEWPAAIAGLLRANGMDAAGALEVAGQRIAGQLQESIRNTDSPPNSPVTDLLKQRFPMGGQKFSDVLKARADVKAGVRAPAGKPLIHTGQMWNAVGHEVRTT